MRKRPLLCMACFFLLGILWKVNGTIAYPVGMLAFLLYGVNRLRRQRCWLRLIGRSLLLLSLFMAGYFHMNQNLAFRQEYMGRLMDGNAITIQGEIYKKEFKNEQYLYYLKDCVAVYSKRNIQTNSVIAYFKEDQYSIGQVLVIKGKVKLFAEARNEGNFDIRAYYQSQKIDFGVTSGKVKQISGKRNGFSEKMYQLKIRLQEVFETYLSEEDAGVLSVMLLGEKSSLDKEVRLLYQKAGISHVLAISGLHVSLIGLGFYHLLRKCRCRYKLAGVIASGLLISYGVMTGMGISTQRAIGMFLLTMLGLVVERSYDLLNGLGAMALYLLVCNPFLISYSGFVFSFMAILGVGVTGKILCNFWKHGSANMRQSNQKNNCGNDQWNNYENEHKKHQQNNYENEYKNHQQNNYKNEHKKHQQNNQENDWKNDKENNSENNRKNDKENNRENDSKNNQGNTRENNNETKLTGDSIYQRIMQWKKALRDTMIMSMGIQLTTLPLVAFYYYEIPIYAILINLIVIPLLSIVVVSGILGGLAGLVTIHFPVLLFLPCKVILSFYSWICSMCEKLPCSQYLTGQPAKWKLIVYYSVLAMGLYWMYWNAKKAAKQEELQEKYQSDQSMAQAAESEMRGHVSGKRRNLTNTLSKKKKKSCKYFI